MQHVTHKLVRDHIPELIKETGAQPRYYTATDSEYLQRLEQKLVEEVQEFILSHETEELADILEVLYAFCDVYHIPHTSLEEIRKEKSHKKGSFSKKIILQLP